MSVPAVVVDNLYNLRSRSQAKKKNNKFYAVPIDETVVIR